MLIHAVLGFALLETLVLAAVLLAFTLFPLLAVISISLRPGNFATGSVSLPVTGKPVISGT